MKAGLLFLVLGYFLSQFYRSFLAVLTPVLGAEIGTTSADPATVVLLMTAPLPLRSHSRPTDSMI